MINLMIGPPGGGKSYETTVYHILASIEAGRKVITNLPLNIDEFSKIVPAARTLIELRNRVGKPGEPETWAFGHLDDYGDAWRHPETNIGALYVIDEAHKPLPKRGPLDKGGVKIDEWYAEHRHEGCDVLLLTQSYGKISKPIVDLVQVCYRVKKKTVFGDSSGYIRKVQDGVRGDVMSIAERTYEPRYFKLYKSHTRSTAAVLEADAKDVAPAFLKWKRASRLVLVLGVAGLGYSAWGYFTRDEKPKEAPAARASAARNSEHGEEDRAAGAPTAPPARAEPPPAPAKPQDGPSDEARIVGAVTGLGAKSFAIVYTKDREYRLPLLHCRSDDFAGWVCPSPKGWISSTTGPEPPRPGSGGGLLGGLVKTGS